jgi:hypothetical protein
MIRDSVNMVITIVVTLLSMGNVMIVLVSIPVSIRIFAAVTIMISVAVVLPLPVALCLRLVRSRLGLYFLRQFHGTLCPSGTCEQQ